jgi:hypothetical protein
MSQHLTTYLNDHFAGSVGALELLDHLIKTYKGKPLEQFFKDLCNEIDADQGELRDLKKNRRRGKRGSGSGLMGGREVLPREDSIE